ncbi:sensor histidine kinase [Streptosporangium sp. NPDC051022]|uniref:sensor histidine kinase n=1 Tax=Streptosporangium sp. NPDC051022 TaxID=3155752 RepID=UPI0034388EF0
MRATVTALIRRAGEVDPRIVDALLAVALTGMTLVWAVKDDSGPWRRPDAAAVALTLVANLPVAVRRRAPVIALAVCSAASFWHHSLGYQPNVNNFSILLTLYTVTVLRSPRVAVAGIAAAAAVWWWASLMSTAGMAELNMLQSALVILTAWVLGMGTRRLADRNRRLAELTERLRRQREAEASRAVAEERVRIARELHDIVAHHMSVISVQAGLARYVFASDPHTASCALATVADTSHEALEEMRRLLAVLRVDHRPGGDGLYDPTPGLTQLGQLVERVRGAGVPVDLEVTGRPRSLNPGVELCAYRVVQESLTNVIKHAFPARARVRLHYGGEELLITVTDDGSPSQESGNGGGLGLIGMRERVRLYGGRIVSGPLARGGFEVSATVPLSPPEGPRDGRGDE